MERSKMAEVVALRMDDEFLKRIDKLGKEDSEDRSTVIRKLLNRGYNEFRKEKSAQLYKQGKITFSEAAHKAGLTLWETLHFFVDKGIKSSYSVEDMEDEMKKLKT